MLKKGTYRFAVITQIEQIPQMIIDLSDESEIIRKKDNQSNLLHLINRPNGAC